MRTAWGTVVKSVARKLLNETNITVLNRVKQNWTGGYSKVCRNLNRSLCKLDISMAFLCQIIEEVCVPGKGVLKMKEPRSRKRHRC